MRYRRPLLCNSGKLGECPGTAMSCVDICSRAGTAASQGGTVLLRGLESGSKNLNEKRGLAKSVRKHISDIREMNMMDGLAPPLAKAACWVHGKSPSHKSTLKTAVSLLIHVPRETTQSPAWSICRFLRNIKHYDIHKVPTAKGHTSMPWMGKHIQNSL